jgi:hypothetical protein
MRKILTIVSLLAVFATPAFAQSSNSVAGKYSSSITRKSIAQDAPWTARASADSAFAMAPDPYSPALNGGGSEGYNRAEAHTYEH